MMFETIFWNCREKKRFYFYYVINFLRDILTHAVLSP